MSHFDLGNGRGLRPRPRKRNASPPARTRRRVSVIRFFRTGGLVARPRSRWRPIAAAAAVLVGIVFLAAAGPASAADLRPGWGQWWLPPVRSAHGGAIDSLFLWTFWITMITFIAVEVVLIIFLIRYRSRPDKKKAHFTHGNTKLEMAWTLF